MLGFRGCRLGITYPEITEMQVRGDSTGRLGAGHLRSNWYCVGGGDRVGVEQLLLRKARAHHDSTRVPPTCFSPEPSPQARALLPMAGAGAGAGVQDAF